MGIAYPMKPLILLLLLSSVLAQPVLFSHQTTNAIAGENATIYLTAAAGEPNDNITDGDFIDIRISASIKGETSPAPTITDSFLWTRNFNKTYSLELAIPERILLNFSCTTETDCVYTYETPAEGVITLGVKRFDVPTYTEAHARFIILAPNHTEDVAYYTLNTEEKSSGPTITWIWILPLLLAILTMALFYLKKAKAGIACFVLTILTLLGVLFL